MYLLLFIKNEYFYVIFIKILFKMYLLLLLFIKKLFLLFLMFYYIFFYVLCNFSLF